MKTELPEATQKGIERVVQDYNTRTEYGDKNYSDFITRISPDIGNLKPKIPKWHKSWYANFTSARNIQSVIYCQTFQ